MILLLALACHHEASDSATPEAFAPTLGVWTAHIDATWGGDCALEDDHTWQEADQRWVLDEYRDGFAVRDETGYWYPCTLDDHDFLCELPVIDDDLSSLGLDVHATYTPTWGGAFSDEAHLSGLYSVAAVCEGEDCDQLTGYGEDFQFPCTAEAGLSAELGDESDG